MGAAFPFVAEKSAAGGVGRAVLRSSFGSASPSDCRCANLEPSTSFSKTWINRRRLAILSASQPSCNHTTVLAFSNATQAFELRDALVKLEDELLLELIDALVLPELRACHAH